MTRDELAAHFKVSRQTVNDWKLDGCPIDDGVAAIRSWLGINRPKRAVTLPPEVPERKPGWWDTATRHPAIFRPFFELWRAVEKERPLCREDDELPLWLVDMSQILLRYVRADYVPGVTETNDIRGPLLELAIETISKSFPDDERGQHSEFFRNFAGADLDAAFTDETTE